MKSGKAIPSTVRSAALAMALVAAVIAPPTASAAPPECPGYQTATQYHTPVTISVACTDPDGDDIVSYQAFAGALGASVSVNGSTITYTPPIRFPGSPIRFTGWDAFKYSATDAAGETSEEYVAVHVNAYVSFSLKPAGGKVRVKSAGRWRTLVGKQTMPLRSFQVDARNGRVWLIWTERYRIGVSVKARLTGGAFKAVVDPPTPPSRKHKLGTIAKLKGLRLAGPMDCNGSGRGRLMRVEATWPFTIFARHLIARNSSRRGQRAPARYTVADRCDGSSTVTNHRGRVSASHSRDAAGEVVRPGRTYVARPPG